MVAPNLTTDQMVEVDRAMVEDFGIELIQMMENAGRNLAHLARTRFLDGDPRGRRVTVVAGSGGNGGGALVCARRLACWGAQVDVRLAKAPDGLTAVPRHQLEIARRMGLAIESPDAAASDPKPELVVDGLIGYSLRGAPRGRTAELIAWANAQAAPVLALDVPSGVDASSGTIHEPAIEAAATMTLALPKVGLRGPTVRAHVGELYLADISVPPQLYAGKGLELAVDPIFACEDIVRLPDEALASD